MKSIENFTPAQDYTQSYDKVWTEEIPVTFDQNKEALTIPKKKFVQYDIEFDMQQYQKLRELRNSLFPHEFQQKLAQANAFTDAQMTTMLGERYNQALSTIHYDMRDGKLYGQNTDEPAIEMWKRGRDYRKENGSTEHDQLRETAEVNEFAKVDIIMNHEHTPVGTMVVCISPPSGRDDSIYRHNFYDVYTKTETGTEMRRYSSCRTLEEYKQKVEELTGEAIDGPLNDITFKDRGVPIIIDPFNSSDIKTAEDIHNYFHSKHEVMDDVTFKKILRACERAKERYMRQLEVDPMDKRRVGALYNLVLLSAQEAYDKIQQGEEIDEVEEKYGRNMNEERLYYLASQKIRAVAAACGESGGVNIGGSSIEQSALGPYNVLTFGMEYKKTLSCTCPFCKQKVDALIEGGRITCTNPTCKKSAPYNC